MVDAVAQGREAFARQAWGQAYRLIGSAEHRGRDDLGREDLGGEDLERLAVAAYLVGRDEESVGAWERSHRSFLSQHDTEGAARTAFWAGFLLTIRGQGARGAGWLGRAERLAGEASAHSIVGGLVKVAHFLECLGSGDATAARQLGTEIVAIAQRGGDADLLALGVLSCGQAALALGETGPGLRLLDEVMVSVTAGELSPVPAGICYCAVIEACVEMRDHRRAAAWVGALDRWCRAQPDLVPYRGQCLVHRSEVLQAQGQWAEAVLEAERARHHLSDPVHPALGLAHYQAGELHRLQGRFAEAEAAYTDAAAQGREPSPGLALLRLAQGDGVGAAAMARRMMHEPLGSRRGPATLAAAVEIFLGAGDGAAARVVSDQLTALADGAGLPLLEAEAGYAAAAVLLAEGDAVAALAALRRSCRRWRELAMPHGVARGQVLVAAACAALGDHHTARLEREAARATFERLGARPDLHNLGAVIAPTGAKGGLPGRLTARECEVLRLVAKGKTNREIGLELFISVHTVARHLQNVFAKLDVSSRSALAAYAYEHGLV